MATDPIVIPFVVDLKQPEDALRKLAAETQSIITTINNATIRGISPLASNPELQGRAIGVAQAAGRLAQAPGLPLERRPEITGDIALLRRAFERAGVSTDLITDAFNNAARASEAVAGQELSYIEIAQQRLATIQENAAVLRSMTLLQRQYASAVASSTADQALLDAAVKDTLAQNRQYARSLAESIASEAKINAEKLRVLAGDREYGRQLARSAAAQVQIDLQRTRALAGDRGYLRAVAQRTRLQAQLAASEAQLLASSGTYARSLARRARYQAAIAAEEAEVLASTGTYARLLARRTAAQAHTAAVEAEALADTKGYASSLARRRVAQAEIVAQENAVILGNSQYIEALAQATIAKRAVAEAEKAIIARETLANPLAAPSAARATLQQRIIKANEQAALLGSGIRLDENATLVQLVALEQTNASLQKGINDSVATKLAIHELGLTATGEAAALEVQGVRAAAARIDREIARVAELGVLVGLDEAAIAVKTQELQESRKLVTILRERELLEAQLGQQAATAGVTRGIGGVRLPPTPPSGGGGGAGGAGGAGGFGFFGGGLRSVIRYGLPGTLFYGAITELRSSFEEATKLQVELDIIRGTLSAIGPEGGASFGEVRDGIFGVSDATATLASEVASVQRQLAGAFAGDDLLPNFDRARLESEAAFQLSRVAGLPTQEITDSLTAVALAFDEPVGAFERIGDLAVGLESQFGVLSSETIRFVADLAPLGAELGFTADQLAIYGAAAQRASGQAGGALAEQFRRILPGLLERGAELQRLFSGIPDVARQIGEAIGAGNVSQVFELLLRNYARLDDVQKNQLASLVGGRREAGAFLSVLNAAPSVLQQLGQGTDRFAGGLEERFASVREGFAFSFDELKRSIERLGITLIESGLADAVLEIVKALDGLFQILGFVADVANVFDDALGGVPFQVLGLVGAFYSLDKVLGLLFASFTRTGQAAVTMAQQASSSTQITGQAAATAQVQVGAGGAGGVGGQLASAALLLPFAVSTLQGSYRAGAEQDLGGYFQNVLSGVGLGALRGGVYGAAIGGISAAGAALAGRLFGDGGGDAEEVILESVYEADDFQQRFERETQRRVLEVEAALEAYDLGVASQQEVLDAYASQLSALDAQIAGRETGGLDATDLRSEAARIRAEMNQWLTDVINSRFDALDSVAGLNVDPGQGLDLARSRLAALLNSGAASADQIREAAIGVFEAQRAVLDANLQAIEDPLQRYNTSQAGVEFDRRARVALARATVSELIPNVQFQQLANFFSEELPDRVSRVVPRSQGLLDVLGTIEQGFVQNAGVLDELQADTGRPAPVTISADQLYDDVLRVALGQAEVEDIFLYQVAQAIRARIRAMQRAAEALARLFGKDSPAFTALRSIVEAQSRALGPITDILESISLLDIGDTVTGSEAAPSAEDAANAARELAEARLNYALALVENDPIEAARIAQQQADVAYQFAETEAERINAQADRIRADRQLQDAIDNIFNSRTELAIALAETAGDEVLAAELGLKLVRDQIQQALGRGAGEAELNALRAEEARAVSNLGDVRLQNMRDEIEFNLEMGNITRDQAIAQLRGLLALADTEEETRDLLRRIRALTEEGANQDLQFNLPTQLGLPTPYEVRRLQGGGGNFINGGGYSDNRVITVNVTAKTDASPDLIAKTVVGVIGDPKRFGSFGKRY